MEEVKKDKKLFHKYVDTLFVLAKAYNEQKDLEYMQKGYMELIVSMMHNIEKGYSKQINGRTFLRKIILDINDRRELAENAYIEARMENDYARAHSVSDYCAVCETILSIYNREIRNPELERSL